MKTTGILMLAALSTLALAARTTDDKGQEKQEKMEAQAVIGKPAPAFELKDLDGKTIKLSDYKDKIVVLEWFNPECPVVAAAHSKGSLKEAAATATKNDGVVWLAINSGGAGMQGSDLDKNKKMRGEWKMDHPVLLDPDGTTGRAYGAKNTPHMFIVDGKGILVYRGAIDNAPEVENEKGVEPVSYVATALRELKAGKAVTKSDTKAYGCSVKYARQAEKEKEKVKG